MLTRTIGLIVTCARLELKAEASKFRLYYLWWVLEPILFVAVFYLVFKVILASPREQFLLFLVCGKIPYFWFSKSINEASNSLLVNRKLISQVAIAKPVFPHAVVLGNTFKQLFVFPLLVALSMVFGFELSALVLWLVPLMLVQLMLIQSCAMIGALLVSFMEDFKPLIQMGTLFLLFSSGIFWDVNDIADPAMREMLLTFNPIAFLIDAYRIVLMPDGRSVDLSHLVLIGLACGILLVGVHALYARLDMAISRNVI